VRFSPVPREDFLQLRVKLPCGAPAAHSCS
jgi:hypothetical protein